MACGPLIELDYDESIPRVRLISKDIHMDEKIMHRAPDLEEVIIGDEDTVTANQMQEVVIGAEESGKVLESAR